MTCEGVLVTPSPPENTGGFPKHFESTSIRLVGACARLNQHCRDRSRQFSKTLCNVLLTRRSILSAAF